MDMRYKIRYDKKFYKDLHLIELRTADKFYKNLKNKMNIMIEDLQLMPRTHKTLYYKRDSFGEYRRIVIKNYSIIYKIVKDEIIILRIFNQKENYLNDKNFMLKEELKKYIVNNVRRINMIKNRTLKNSYVNLKENFNHTITEEEARERYFSKVLDEAITNFEKNPITISLEEWHEHMRREYNIVL